MGTIKYLQNGNTFDLLLNKKNDSLTLTSKVGIGKMYITSYLKKDTFIWIVSETTKEYLNKINI